MLSRSDTIGPKPTLVPRPCRVRPSSPSLCSNHRLPLAGGTLRSILPPQLPKVMLDLLSEAAQDAERVAGGEQRPAGGDGPRAERKRWRARRHRAAPPQRMLQGCGCRSPRSPRWASTLPPQRGAPCGYGAHLTAVGEGHCPAALSGSGVCRHGHTEVVLVGTCPGTTGSCGRLRRCSSRCSRARSWALLPALSWGSIRRERDGSEQRLSPRLRSALRIKTVGLAARSELLGETWSHLVHPGLSRGGLA